MGVIHTMEVSTKMKIKVRSKLGDLLKERGIMQKWVSDKVGATQAQINKWCQNNEDGQALSTPNVIYLLRLQKVLDINIEDMYEEVDE